MTASDPAPLTGPSRDQGLAVAFFASHGGSNMQAVLDAHRDGMAGVRPVLMVGNNGKAECFQRAAAAGVPSVLINTITHPDDDERDRAILQALRDHNADIVCLSGYMKKVGPRTVTAFRNRILNIHPALLPKFGGQGMYGIRVHQAVLEAGETVSGASVHLADEVYDNGPVIAQWRVPVLAGDDDATLAARVLAVEHRLYAAVLQRIAGGEIVLDEVAAGRVEPIQFP